MSTRRALKAPQSLADPPASPALQSLEVFLAVVDQRSLSAGALELGLSQPTVTQRIQGLEASLGVRLLHRGPRSVQLTAAGRILKGYAERMVALRDEMLAELRGQAGAHRGTLRVAASSTPGDYVMPVVLQRFRERFPSLHVVMVVADSAQARRSVCDGESEIGVVGSLPADVRLIAEPFLEDELVVIGRPGHPALQADPLHPRRLTAYSWLIREQGSDTRRTVEALFADRRLRGELSIAMELNSTEALKLAVRAGNGIALVSRRAVESEVRLGVLEARSLSGSGLRRQLALIRSAQRSLSPAGERLWRFVLGPRGKAGSVRPLD